VDSRRRAQANIAILAACPTSASSLRSSPWRPRRTPLSCAASPGPPTSCPGRSRSARACSTRRLPRSGTAPTRRCGHWLSTTRRCRPVWAPLRPATCSWTGRCSGVAAVLAPPGPELAPARTFQVPVAPRGDSAAARQVARALRQAASEVEVAERLGHAVLDDAHRHWTGSSASASCHPLAELDAKTQLVARSLRRAADELDSYARTRQGQGAARLVLGKDPHRGRRRGRHHHGRRGDGGSGRSCGGSRTPPSSRASSVRPAPLQPRPPVRPRTRPRRSPPPYAPCGQCAPSRRFCGHKSCRPCCSPTRRPSGRSVPRATSTLGPWSVMLRSEWSPGTTAVGWPGRASSCSARSSPTRWRDGCCPGWATGSVGARATPPRRSPGAAASTRSRSAGRWRSPPLAGRLLPVARAFGAPSPARLWTLATGTGTGVRPCAARSPRPAQRRPTPRVHLP